MYLLYPVPSVTESPLCSVCPQTCVSTLSCTFCNWVSTMFSVSSNLSLKAFILCVWLCLYFATSSRGLYTFLISKLAASKWACQCIVWWQLLADLKTKMAVSKWAYLCIVWWQLLKDCMTTAAVSKWAYLCIVWWAKLVYFHLWISQKVKWYVDNSVYNYEYMHILGIQMFLMLRISSSFLCLNLTFAILGHYN